MRGKHGLFLSTALVALCADPILAQSQQAQSSGNDQIEEIVVTSEKRPEKLSQTTVTATVVSAEAIQKNQVNDITDLNKLVPAVNLAGTFNGRVPLAIRGVESDSNEAAVGISSGVGIEVDGIPVPSDSFAANDVEDISDIEVLEGPQATLGGRTATSGIINYITHKPTGIWTGSADATFTDDGERHVQANISGPVTDKVLISLFGWGHTTVFPVDNVVLDRNSYADSYGFRDKVTFQPTDDFDATLMTRLSATKSYGGNFVYTYIYPTTHLLLGPTPFAPPFLSPSALISPGIAVNQSNTEYGSPVTAAAESHYDADISLNLNYHIGDYTLNSVTSYQHETRKSVQDLFAVDAYYFTELTGGHLPYNNTQTEWVNVGQTTEEVKLVSPGGDAFNYVVGLFYSDTTTELNEYRGLIPALLDIDVIPDTATYDAYAHANWKVLDETTIVGGLRFNYDSISYKLNQYAYSGAKNPGAIYSAGSSDSTAVVGDIGIKQQITPDATVYFTYTRGYAPEVYNTAFYLAQPGTLTPVAQESIDSFEIGTKGRYFDGTLQVNAALFDTVYNNFQIETYTNIVGAAVGLLTLSSAGAAESKGAEINTTWKPWTDGTIGFDASYDYAVFTDYQGGPCWWAGSDPASFPSSCTYNKADNTWKANLSGKTMPNAPKIKFNLSFDQSVPLGNLPYILDFGGNVSYRARAQMQADQNPYTFERGYALLNLRAGITTDDGNYGVSFFVKNVTNAHYSVDLEDFWNAPWGSNAVVAQPARDTNRYFGATLRAAF